MDEAELGKRRLEGEEKRLADIRAQGTPVTIQTFAEWKRKFDAEVMLRKAQLEPEAVNRDKGPSGKTFFQTQEASGQQVNAPQLSPIRSLLPRRFLSLNSKFELEFGAKFWTNSKICRGTLNT